MQFLKKCCRVYGIVGLAYVQKGGEGAMLFGEAVTNVCFQANSMINRGFFARKPHWSGSKRLPASMRWLSRLATIRSISFPIS